MIRLALAALALTACAPNPAPHVALRDTGRQIYSLAGFDGTRITGDWLQVGGFGTACSGGSMKIGAVTDYALCLPSGIRRGQGALREGVPGRFDLAGLGAFWVLWVDADNRTLVVGSPAGDYGLVLNRTADLPDDRRKGARDILEFNGYDVTSLRFY